MFAEKLSATILRFQQLNDLSTGTSSGRSRSGDFQSVKMVREMEGRRIHDTAAGHVKFEDKQPPRFSIPGIFSASEQVPQIFVGTPGRKSIFKGRLSVGCIL